jgi:hypothetical protein
MKSLKILEDEIASWPYISAHPHRFGAREFRVGKAEVGHVHQEGVVDIPFSRQLHDALLADNLVEAHRWVPNSGWVTFQVRNEEDVKHAMWLMRLSYLRYMLKTAVNPIKLLEQESTELHLNAKFKGLLEQFVPATARLAGKDALTA